MDSFALHEGRNQAREQLIAWLILAFRPPTADSLRQLREADLSGLIDSAELAGGTSLPEMPSGATGQAELSTLASEHVRLFVNSRETEVVFLEATAYLYEQGPEAQSVFLADLVSELRSAGLSPVLEATLPPDHLTVLLERLYYLKGTLREPLAKHPFSARFLQSWIPAMLTRLKHSDPPPMYAVAGAVLALLMGIETDE